MHNFKIAIDRLPENPVVIEVGSHKGDGVRYILEKRPKAKIYAIEPCKESYRKISHDNKFNIAITNENDLKLRRKGSSRQYRMGKSGQDVEAMSLDRFICTQYIQWVDLIRFDCYGSEYYIFGQKNEFLNICTAICITFHKQRIVTINVKKKRKEIYRKLKNAGFKCVFKQGDKPEKHSYQLWIKR